LRGYTTAQWTHVMKGHTGQITSVAVHGRACQILLTTS
jgi:hypothetical protein